jgi:hypothetical protein
MVVLDRKKVISQFPWLIERDQHFIISADYDGLICAIFLNQTLGWKLDGFYDLSSIWISRDGMDNRENLIWVDMNILPKQGRAIGGHIISMDGSLPTGFETSCNPNILTGLTAKYFNKKYPFSTILFLLWIHNIDSKLSEISRMLLLHADASWLKYQNYSENSQHWLTVLSDYPWKKVFRDVNTERFEDKIDQVLYLKLREISALKKRSKLSGIHKKFTSYQYQFNPDWDMDVAMKIFQLIGNSFGWTPPECPDIEKVIDGTRYRIPLSRVKKTGLNSFLSKSKVFSYAITSPGIFNYTTFGYSRKSPIEK